MPTPDDAMPSPPAEHEHESHRTTCPPEESRIHNVHDVHDSPDEQALHPGNDGDTAFIAPTQQPTPPPAESELATGARSPAESHTKSSDIDVDGPMRDIPTPMSAPDEGAEEQQRNPHVSPLSATAPAPVSWLQPSALTSPYPSQRVSTTARTHSRVHALCRGC